MNKAAGLVLIVISALIIAAVVFLSIFKNKKNVSFLTPVKPTPAPTKKVVSGKLKEYIDPSGFKFSYPEEFLITAKEATDQSTYSHLEITSPKVSGQISIRVADSSLKTIDDWFENNKISTKTGEVKNIKLADLEARQFKSKDELITIALDEGVLFTITVDPKENKDLWFATNKKIIDTFLFVAPPEEDTNNSIPVDESSDEVIFEGEEIIE